jgi:hypothetical protein
MQMQKTCAGQSKEGEKEEKKDKKKTTKTKPNSKTQPKKPNQHIPSQTQISKEYNSPV